MPSSSLVGAPAGFVPEVAVVFGSEGSVAVPVDFSNPLPTRVLMAASGITVLTGTSSASSTTVGPFIPLIGRAIVLTLSGIWTGTVQVLRSTDGGTTKLPLTIGGTTWASFTGSCNEPIWEESEAGGSFYLSITLISGTVAYRVAQ